MELHRQAKDFPILAHLFERLHRAMEQLNCLLEELYIPFLTTENSQCAHHSRHFRSHSKQVPLANKTKNHHWLQLSTTKVDRMSTECD